MPHSSSVARTSGPTLAIASDHPSRSARRAAESSSVTPLESRNVTRPKSSTTAQPGAPATASR